LGKEAAEAYALDGVRYPYGPLERRQAVLGTTTSGSGSVPSAPAIVHGLVRIHATTMNAINAWNYFRVSSDRGWLSNTGYPLIAQAADMVSTLAVLNDDGVTYRLQGVVALTDTTTNVEVVDTALAIASSVATLKVACEASYALGYDPPQQWIDVRYGLSLPTLSADKTGAPLSAPYPLARFDGEDLATELATATAAASSGIRLGQQAPEEVLMVLAEPIGTLIENDLGINIVSNVTRNVNVWGVDTDVTDTLMVSSSPGNAVRHLIRLMSIAQAMQLDANMTTTFEASLEAFLDAYSDYSSGAGGFGNLSKRVFGGSDDVTNDVELSALFLLVFIHGIGTGIVQGGFGESGLEYASLGVSLGTSAVMPVTWERIIFTGIGAQQMDAILLNRGIVGTGTGGGSNIVVTLGGGGSNVIYWSTDTLTL